MTWANESDTEPGDVISILGVDHDFCDDVMRTGGSIAWNDQNPGNIVSSSEAVSYGVYPGKHNDNFAVFPDEETGFQAVRTLARVGTIGEIVKNIQQCHRRQQDVATKSWGPATAGPRNEGGTSTTGADP
ncbi:hypothetical protein [Streptomyces sp. NPDC001492]